MTPRNTLDEDRLDLAIRESRRLLAQSRNLLEDASGAWPSTEVPDEHVHDAKKESPPKRAGFF